MRSGKIKPASAHQIFHLSWWIYIFYNCESSSLKESLPVIVSSFILNCRERVEESLRLSCGFRVLVSVVLAFKVSEVFFILFL